MQIQNQRIFKKQDMTIRALVSDNCFCWSMSSIAWFLLWHPPSLPKEWTKEVVILPLIKGAFGF